MDGYLAPGGPGIRVDSHLYPGYQIPTNYDSLLAKVIAWGPTRDIAIARLERSLAEMLITGVDTTIPFLQRVLRSKDFRSGEVSTRLVGELQDGSRGSVAGPTSTGLAPANDGSAAV
ncbi:MAG: hypothetical protein R2849_12495 [Thermomicrobiales bacterium]